MKKLEQPSPITFYLIQNNLYLVKNNQKRDVSHSHLWPKVVKHYFTGLPAANISELNDKCNGTYRGRVVYSKEENGWILQLNRESEKFVPELTYYLALFEQKYRVDFTDLSHDKKNEDVVAVSESLKLVNKLKTSENYQIAEFIEFPNSQFAS